MTGPSAPTNSDQAIAAAAYLKREASRAMPVQDVKLGDPYLQSLEPSIRWAQCCETSANRNPPSCSSRAAPLN